MIKVHDLVIKVRDLVIKVRDLVIKVRDLVIKVRDLVIKVRDLVIKVHDLVIKVHDLVDKVRDLVQQIVSRVCQIGRRVVMTGNRRGNVGRSAVIRPGWLVQAAAAGIFTFGAVDCTPDDPPAPAGPVAAVTASSPVVTAPAVSAAPVDNEDAGAALVADVRARAAAARAAFGPAVRTRVVADAFVLVQPGGPPALFDQAVALLDRAVPALLDHRFGKHPMEAVTVLLFPTHEGYADACRTRGANKEAGAYGVYVKTTREILADCAGGSGYLPTMLHEVAHALAQADFPYIPTWLNEGIASLYEAPVFPADGGIRGQARNGRHARLVAALANPRERGEVRIDALLPMTDDEFNARTDGGTNLAKQALHYAIAREVAAWMDEQGTLWPFYRAFRDDVLDDPTGTEAFRRVTGLTPEAATSTWLKWAQNP